MLTKDQINYLAGMELPRLIKYLNSCSFDDIKRLANNLREFITSDNSVRPQEKEKHVTTLSIVETKLDKVLEKINPQDINFIDTSQFKEITSKELLEILGQTIKRDNENKLITFFAMLSAYTKDSQLNISFNAPSSTGKSYIPLEIAQLFPLDDVFLKIRYHGLERTEKNLLG